MVTGSRGLWLQRRAMEGAGGGADDLRNSMIPVRGNGHCKNLQKKASRMGDKWQLSNSPKEEQNMDLYSWTEGRTVLGKRSYGGNRMDWNAATATCVENSGTRKINARGCRRRRNP